MNAATVRCVLVVCQLICGLPADWICSAVVQVQAPAVVPKKSDVDLTDPIPAKPIRKSHEKSLILPAGIDHDKGVYVLRFVGGKATLEPAEDVELVGPSPAPNPTPIPTPSTLTERAKAIKAAADKATADPKRDETAGGLALVYRSAAEAAEKNPATKPETLAYGVATTSDMVIGRPGQSAAAKAAWQGTRDVLGKQLEKAQEDGAGLAEYVKIYKEAAAGLDASVVNRSVDKDFWKWLIETILPILLKLLFPV